LLHSTAKKRLSKGKDKIEEEIQQERTFKISPIHMKMEEEVPLYPIIIPHSDDPFIIVRQDSRLKGTFQPIQPANPPKLNSLKSKEPTFPTRPNV
jgi:hypothetical protein